jgi:hypothetical protein
VIISKSGDGNCFAFAMGADGALMIDLDQDKQQAGLPRRASLTVKP